MTSNMQNGAPHVRRELDRDRDSGRRSEAIGAGRSSNAASMNLGRDPVPSELFRAHSLEDSLREWLSHAHRAADVFSDEEILALSEDWATQLVERLVVEPLVLLENEAYIEDDGSTRASVLVVPFTGDPDLFELDPRPLRSRSGPGYMPGPFGSVTEDALHLELTNTPGLSPGAQLVETRLAPVRNHVESLRSALERFQADLRDVLLQALEHRREQAEVRRWSPASASLPVDDVTTRRRRSRRHLFSHGQDRNGPRATDVRPAPHPPRRRARRGDALMTITLTGLLTKGGCPRAARVRPQRPRQRPSCR